ncbi:MAG: hypothetical protein HeimC2_42320 [Candidatus Heimdallarchaeota archaeon LC_2]|nr:MAG: hypothetical protein HeimC2_42320 [Candidatus Heimdallarchaeota archaeon LC_2]
MTEKIELPKGKNHWAAYYSFALPNWILFNTKENTRQVNINKEWKSYLWSPKMRWVSTLDRMTDGTYEAFKIINHFCMNIKKNRIDVITEKERSAILFGDEKKLNSLYLSYKEYADLYDLTDSYSTHEPIVYEKFESSERKMLIIENRDTFDSFVKSNHELTIPYYRWIVYGSGLAVLSQVRTILEFNVSEITYFGDVDYTGFHIYQELKKKYYALRQESGLPEIVCKLDNELYNELLWVYEHIKWNFPSYSSKKYVLENDIFNTDLRIQFQELMDNGNRIPQELLNRLLILKILQNRVSNSKL